MGEPVTFRLMATYSQFQLVDAQGDTFEELRLPADHSLVHDSDGRVLVRTGSYGAPVSVQVEYLDAQPAALPQEWEDVVEFSVVARGGVALCELFEGAREPVSGPGAVRIRVAARGRDEGMGRGEVGQRARVVEQFLMQLWLSAPAVGVTVKATSLRPVDHTAGRVHLVAAREAADRINTDLARAPGHRPLSGATGVVTARWTYPTTRRKLYRPAALPNLWTSASGSESSADPAVGVEYRLSNNRYRAVWDGIPTGPSHVWIEAVVRKVEPPKSAVTTWEWVTGPTYGDWQSLLTTTLTVELEQHATLDGTPETTLHLRHEGLPVEWLSDMKLCWLCKLESGDKVYSLAR